MKKNLKEDMVVFVTREFDEEILIKLPFFIAF